MKLINNRWVDNNNNSWSADIDTKELAQKKSNTLINCSNCSDCSNCSNCSNCLRCSYCSDCSRCSYCSDCSRCSNSSNCSYCSYCSRCAYCSYCSCCSYCSDCSEFKSNPERITSPTIGSRESQSTYYWNEEHEQLICGCFKGTLDEFEQRVKEVHGDNAHGIAYQNWIDKIRIYKN